MSYDICKQTTNQLIRRKGTNNNCVNRVIIKYSRQYTCIKMVFKENKFYIEMKTLVNGTINSHYFQNLSDTATICELTAGIHR